MKTLLTWIIAFILLLSLVYLLEVKIGALHERIKALEAIASQSSK